MIPLEVALEGGRQSSFVLFAIIVAVTMETIPLLLSGIHLDNDEHESSNKSESPKTQTGDSENLNHNERNKASSKSKRHKTAINQISNIVSLLIFDLRKLTREIFNSVVHGVGTTDSVSHDIKEKLRKVLVSAEVNDSSKKEFLRLFYNAINSENREISLLNFPSKAEFMASSSTSRL
ncbi:MAG: hypothetical protein HC820_07725 [Hydrococcus sp. RM1_1_31]|nr:hypothetical protein [Hydrococcus sp. RM1_1_31]